MTGKIIGIVICLIFSAFFSATETAFTSLNRIRIKNLASDGNKRAKLVLELSDKYDMLLSTILVGNNIVNIALTAIATLLFIEMYPMYGGAVSTAITTVVVLIFGEISPKSLAMERSESFAMKSAPLIKFFMILLYPINYLFKLWKKLLSKVFKVGSKNQYTEDDLLTIVTEAETEGAINEDQSELIQNAIEFHDLEAWDVITPRVDVISIDITDSKEEIAEVFKKTGFSRLPVCEGDLDKVVGVLNQKDFHTYIKNSDLDVSECVKPVIYVAGSMKLSQLLKKLQTEKSHIAIIIDEYGGMAGIVTMEDIIEEIVGDIYDEHDQLVLDDIVKLDDGSYRVKTNSNLDKFFDEFNVEGNYDATTVNGWVMIELDKLPEVGDHFKTIVGNIEFDVVVTHADNRKSLEIKVKTREIEGEE